MKALKTILTSMLLASGSASILAASPAFDCKKSAHEIEELICKDEKLAALDRSMDRIYKKAMQALPDEEKKVQRSIQRGWIKGRNDCWKEDDRESCAILSYERRITELQIISGQQVVPEPVQYQCDGGKHDYLTAIFHTKTQMPAVVLTRVSDSMDDQEIAYIVPSGSGAKYMGNKTVFWVKGKESMGTWADKPFKCKEQ
jgi:uncharacterized protein